MNIVALYNSKDYTTILECFEKEIFTASDHDYYYLGLCLFELGYTNESREILLNVIGDRRDYDSSKGACYIGLSYYSIGEYSMAYMWFETSRCMNGEFSKEAENWLRLLHISKQNEPTNFIENAHMRFHFVNCFSESLVRSFVTKYTKAYKRIISFLEVKLPKKIDVFVYAGHEDSIGGNLSYANSPLATIHVYIFEDCGHELAHVLSYYIPNGISRKCPFVDEGVAEFFNETKYYTNFDRNEHNIDIFELWTNFRAYDRNFSHAIAKRFFLELIERGGKDKLLDLLKDQTISNAKRLYGDLLVEVKNHTERDVLQGKFDYV